jgi:hypothetical protein
MRDASDDVALRHEHARVPCDRHRRRLIIAAGALAATAGPALPSLAGSALERDEGVVVTPSTARRLDEARVELHVRAWVYEREGRRVLSRALAKALGLDLDELDATERALFVERTRLFAREAQARRRLHWRASAAAPWMPLPPSNRDGSVDARVVVPRDALEAAGATASRAFGFEVGDASRRVAARAHLCGDHGVSLVSDIDDTIKVTHVRDRRQMLLETFARPFGAVPGMRAWYDEIAAAGDVAFHYVSSGPWMLAPAIEAFLRDEAFAPGSLHMRAFSLKPHALMDEGASSRHKHATIERLLADWPQRRFVLVGDSGEQDPEIYGALARRHPSRIAAILVRDVTGDHAQGARYREAMAGVPRQNWSFFDDPARLPRSWAWWRPDGPFGLASPPRLTVI